MQVKFVKPNQELIDHIALHMRDEDVVEVGLMAGYSPLDAVQRSVDNSDMSAIAVINGIPSAAFGVSSTSPLKLKGIPWLLSTNTLNFHKTTVVRYGKIIIEQMLEYTPSLENYVHADNHRNIKFLKYLGFTIEAPSEFGKHKGMFCRFHKVK